MENKFKFLTKHSLNKKIKTKLFLISNIVLAIIIIALVNIDGIVKYFGGDFNDDLKISIIDNAGYYSEIKDNLSSVKEFLDGNNIIINKETNLKKAKKSLKGSNNILLVINQDDNTFNAEFISDSYIDMIRYQAIVSSLNTTKVNIAMNNSSIDKNELDKINAPVEVKRSFVDKDKTKDEETSKSILSVASLILVLPCFMLIVFLVQMIGAEINEEKSTRGMEIIIGNVSAKTHFFSKILASNLFVLIQSILLIIYSVIGLIVRKFTTPSSDMINSLSDKINVSEIIDMVKNSGIIDKLGYIIPLLILLFVLSFLAYSLLSGILASMTTNMENFQQLQTPLMIISVVGYYLIIISTAFPGALFIKIASVIPLLSISLTPSLILSGEITASMLILAIVLLALLDYVLIKYGLKIYKVGILNYSETNLWKKIFKAIKD